MFFVKMETDSAEFQNDEDEQGLRKCCPYIYGQDAIQEQITATFEGTDGSGMYGTGFTVTAILPEPIPDEGEQ